MASQRTRLQAHPEVLGGAPYNATSALPYLFKILSVAKALSIQAHPDRARAAVLHAAFPDQYKDDNHKPEMAVALTPFEAMCGFRAPHEIAAFLRAVPPLAVMVGPEAAAALEAAADPEAVKAALRAVFASFMAKAGEGATLAACTSELAALLAARPAAAAAAPGGAGYTLLDPYAVAARLCADFPGDIGVFAPFLLNTLTLLPGAAVFLAANEPHAYLSGDCAEIMACSDNVVRAGLTPKWKHVEELVSMLTYSAGTPPVTTGATVAASGWATTTAFEAPVPEFGLLVTAVSSSGAGADAHALPACAGASVLVATGSDGASVAATLEGAAGSFVITAGDALLLPAGAALRLTPGSGSMTLFQAIPGK